MRFAARFALSLAVLALGSTLAACSTTREADFRLAPGQPGRAMVWGSEPTVEVENRGPGTVELDWDPENALPLTKGGNTVILKKGDSDERTLADLHIFQFTPTGGQAARVHIEADDALAVGGADDREAVKVKDKQKQQQQNQR